MLYMFQAVFRPSSGAQTVHTASVASGSSKQLNIYQMLYVQFELLMMGGKPPEICRALTAIKNIV